MKVFLQCSDRVWNAALQYEDLERIDRLIDRTVHFSTRACYEGFLALPDLLVPDDAPLLRRTVGLISDAIDAEDLAFVLQTYLEAIASQREIDTQGVAETLIIAIGSLEILKGTNPNIVQIELYAATGRILSESSHQAR